MHAYLGTGIEILSDKGPGLVFRSFLFWIKLLIGTGKPKRPTVGLGFGSFPSDVSFLLRDVGKVFSGFQTPWLRQYPRSASFGEPNNLIGFKGKPRTPTQCGSYLSESPSCFGLER